jgi:hypothetical protein
MKVIFIRFIRYEVSWDSLIINRFAVYNALTAPTYFISYKTNKNPFHFLKQLFIFLLFSYPCLIASLVDLIIRPLCFDNLQFMPLHLCLFETQKFVSFNEIFLNILLFLLSSQQVPLSGLNSEG